MNLSSRLCGGLALLALSVATANAQPDPAPLPAAQSAGMDVDFAYFEQRLSAFGHWISHPVWGDVWQPDAGRDFRPYFYGYWQYTSDYGWLWVSSEPYGDIVYHYGRWAYDPNFGWLWVPGYVWGPSWVAWRETDGYIGWLPMPPGYQDFALPSVAPSYGPDQLYGYQNFYGSYFPPDAFADLWVFVPTGDFGRSDRRRYVFDRDRVRDLYRHSNDRTHYLHDRDHDRIVDRSIDKDALERATHRHFDEPAGRRFLRSGTPPASVSEGQNIARRDRDRVRGGVPDGANPPRQGTPADIGGRPARGLASPQSPQSRPGLRGFARRDAPQSALGQDGPAPETGTQTSAPQIPPNSQRREFGRFPERNSLAPAVRADAPSTDIPSTDFSRAPRNRLVPPPVPQPEAQSGVNAAGRAPAQANPRSLGMHPAPFAAVPNVAMSPPPSRPVPPIVAPSAPAVPVVRSVQPASPPVPAALPPQAAPRAGPRGNAANGGL